MLFLETSTLCDLIVWIVVITYCVDANVSTFLMQVPGPAPAVLPRPCFNHFDCCLSEYCSTSGYCTHTSDCLPGDSMTNACPPPSNGLTCRCHSDCNVRGGYYCDENSECWEPCGDCIRFTDSIDGTCPCTMDASCYPRFTISGQVRDAQCVFPFTYNGVTYDDCTNVEDTNYWCATNVDVDGNLANAEWGVCNECGPQIHRCNYHYDCAANEYCDTVQKCWPCGFCEEYADAIDETCPTCPCFSHSDCAGQDYCDEAEVCYGCSLCSFYQDSMDGFCPACVCDSHDFCELDADGNSEVYCDTDGTCNACVAGFPGSLDGTGGPKCECYAHSDCIAGDEYCDTLGSCYPCEDCPRYDDPVDETCPICGCLNNDDCWPGTQYCQDIGDIGGLCSECDLCEPRADSLTEECPICDRDGMPCPANLIPESGCPENDVYFSGVCYYLDGSGGACDFGYELATQTALRDIAPLFNCITYKHTTSDNCCIYHSDMVDGEDWGVHEDVCNQIDYYWDGNDIDIAQSDCIDVQFKETNQLTLCRSTSCTILTVQNSNAVNGCAFSEIGDICDVTCNDGFEKIGEDPICGQDFLWSEVRCNELRCEEGVTVGNSNISHACQDTPIGGTCPFECSEGFSANKTEANCLAGGMWSAVACSAPPDAGLSEDEIFIAVIASYVGLLILLVLAGKCKFRHGENDKILVAGLGIADFVTDCAFAWQLWNIDDTIVAVSNENTIDPGTLKYLPIIFICASVFVNICILFYLLNTEFKDPEVRNWFKLHSGGITAVFLLALTHMDIIRILGSNIFGLAIFSAPFTKATRTKLGWLGLSTLLLEDIPEVILVVLVIVRWGALATQITVATIATSIISILFGVVNRLLHCMLWRNERAAERNDLDTGGVEMYDSVDY